MTINQRGRCAAGGSCAGPGVKSRYGQDAPGRNAISVIGGCQKSRARRGDSGTLPFSRHQADTLAGDPRPAIADGIGYTALSSCFKTPRPSPPTPLGTGKQGVLKQVAVPRGLSQFSRRGGLGGLGNTLFAAKMRPSPSAQAARHILSAVCRWRREKPNGPNKEPVPRPVNGY